MTSIIALTGSSTFLDQDNRDFWLNNRSETLDDISTVGRLYGEISYAGILSGTLYFGGKISKNKDLAITGRMLIEGLFYAGLTTTVIKFVTGRSRPYTNDGHLTFRFFQTDNDYTAFPSGHSTVAFTLSSILSDRIDNTYASIGLYSIALLTLWQRMYSDNHWLSDTIMGAAIGYFIGKAVVKFDDDSDYNKSNLNNPELNNSRYYELFSLTYSF
ncbi:MAG: phosphatase PAP2 family protein [Ignavibacterium sp.]